MIIAPPEPAIRIASRVRVRGIARAAALFIAAWYFYFTWDRVNAPFAADDMMNLAIYFRQTAAQLFTSHFLVWENNYRPMGAAFYLPLYSWFGLHPAPYQMAVTLLIGVNTYLIYVVARNLRCNRLTAFFAAFLGAYHAGMGNIYYNTDMVYDVLCFLFYFSAFNYYARLRKRSSRLSVRQLTCFFGLYLCALNSKEMAVTLPVVLLAYEWYLSRPDRLNWPWVRSWAAGPGVVIGLAGVLNLIYIYGKAVGPRAIMHNPAYSPVFTLGRVLDFQRGSIKDLLCLPFVPDLFGLAVVWTLVTCLAWMRKVPALRFCWICILVMPLPIEFLADRFQGELYIPMAVWVVFLARVLVDGAASVASALQERPHFHLLGRRGIQAAVLGAVSVLWFLNTSDRKADYVVPGTAGQGIVTKQVIAQFRELHPRVRPHGSVIFLNDPFEQWDMVFLTLLYFHDPHLDVHLQRLRPVSKAEIARADAVFDYRSGRLIQVR